MVDPRAHIDVTLSNSLCVSVVDLTIGAPGHIILASELVFGDSYEPRRAEQKNLKKEKP